MSCTTQLHVFLVEHKTQAIQVMVDLTLLHCLGCLSPNQLTQFYKLNNKVCYNIPKVTEQLKCSHKITEMFYKQIKQLYVQNCIIRISKICNV